MFTVHKIAHFYPVPIQTIILVVLKTVERYSCVDSELYYKLYCDNGLKTERMVDICELEGNLLCTKWQ